MPANKVWFKLDNAAKIFPGQNTSRWSNIFRCSITLKETVRPEVLEQAVVNTLVRFPCFDVRIRRGFFWYYFEKNPLDAPPVMPDISNLCHRVRFSENNRFLFRVYFHERKISVEFFHALTDGKGAAVFLSTLTAEYLRLLGHEIPPGGDVLDINKPAKRSELIDPFTKCGTSKAKIKRNSKLVYHAVGNKLPPHTVRVTTGRMSVDELKEKAGALGVTITEYLAGVLLFVHYQKQKAEKRRQKGVSVQIAVNLRKPFDMYTLRNFSLAYNCLLDPNMGDYTLEEIVRKVSLYLRYINDEKTLRAMTSSNLKLERNFLMRAMPLTLKNTAIGLSFLLTGEKTVSALLTNLGVVRLPDEMKPFVEHFDFIAGPGKLNGARCGAASFNGSFSLTIVNIYESTDIERAFFTTLVKQGIAVKIESNMQD